MEISEKLLSAPRAANARKKTTCRAGPFLGFHPHRGKPFFSRTSLVDRFVLANSHRSTRRTLDRFSKRVATASAAVLLPNFQSTSPLLTWFLQQLINGLALGSIYALIALGYTMVYGVLRFINFAHSDVLMLGAFAAYFLAPVVGHVLPVGSYSGALVVLLAAAAICAAIGILIEIVAYRPLRTRPKLTVLITAIGVSLFIEFTGQHPRVLGAATQPFPALIPEHSVHVGGLIVGSNDLIVVPALTALLLAAMWFIVQKTKMGTAMRAVSFNHQAAALMGVNINRVISFTFGLGSALAAVAGMLYALKSPAIEPLMGIQPGLRAFIAAVARRHRQSPRRGARRPAARTFGNLRRRHARRVELPRRHRLRDPHPDPPFQAHRPPRQSPDRESMNTAAFNHEGTKARRGMRREGRGSLERVVKLRAFAPSWFHSSPRMSLPGAKRWLLVAIAAAFLVSYFFAGSFNRYYLGIAIDVGIAIILATSLNLINGYTGQFSLGHAGFMGVGGFTAAKLSLVFAPQVPTAALPWLFAANLLAGGLFAALQASSSACLPCGCAAITSPSSRLASGKSSASSCKTSRPSAPRAA